MLFIPVWRTVVVAWTWCDFLGPFVWLSGLLGLKTVSSCWISADLVLWDPWNIKKAVCDLTIGPGPSHATRRNPGQECHDFNRGVDIMLTFLYFFSQILSWPVFPWWWMTAIKLLLVFYHRTTWVAGSLIEISDCQHLYTFHRRGWLLFASSLWCVAKRGGSTGSHFLNSTPFCFRE